MAPEHRAEVIASAMVAIQSGKPTRGSIAWWAIAALTYESMLRTAEGEPAGDVLTPGERDAVNRVASTYAEAVVDDPFPASPDTIEVKEADLHTLVAIIARLSGRESA